VTGFTDWSASWPALGCYAVLAPARVAGLARLPDQARPRARAAVAFQSGLLLALLTLVSPAGYRADRFSWLRAAAADRGGGGAADAVAERGGVGGAVGRAGLAADPAQECLVGAARY
jgi:hypothetical protein